VIQQQAPAWAQPWDDERIQMAELITGDELREAVDKQTFVKGGDQSGAEGVKYDFRLSNHILKAEFGTPIDASKLSPNERCRMREFKRWADLQLIQAIAAAY